MGYLGEAYVHGFDGLIIGLALLGGLVLSAILIGPAVQGSGAASLPEYLEVRFGRAAGTVACVIMTAAAILLLTAELVVSALIVSSLSGIDDGAIIVALGLFAATLTLVARTRVGPLTLAALAAGLVVSLCGSVWIVSGGDPLPFVHYGSAVSEIATHEAGMMDRALPTSARSKLMAAPFWSSMPSTR